MFRDGIKNENKGENISNTLSKGREGSANFFLSGQIVNILGLGAILSVTYIQLCQNMTMDIYVNKQIRFVPVKFYL